MTRVTVDDALRKGLENIHTCVELCDAHGRTLGYFTPASPGPDAPFQPRVSDEELRRRESEETFSTAEVKARLERL